MTLKLTTIPANNGSGQPLNGGVHINDESGAGTGPNDLVHVVIDSTQQEPLGTTADVAWGGSGSGSIIALLKAIWTWLNGTAATASNQATANTALAAIEANVATAANQATGNTNTTAIAAAAGTTADVAWGGSGNASIIALLKAIWTKLSASIAVTGTFWQATQPISAAALPLPTGAAQESGGNLATVAAQTTTTATETTAIAAAAGTIADAAWSGTGNSSLVAALKAIYAALKATITTTPSKGTGAYSAGTVGTASAELLAAGSASVFLDIVNESPTATIAINFGSAAVINGAGSITIPPGWHRSWEGSFIPTDQINAIASAASTPVTIGAK